MPGSHGKPSEAPPGGIPGRGGLDQNLAWGFWAAAAAITKLPKGAPNWASSWNVENYLKGQKSTRIDEARKPIHSGVGDAIQTSVTKLWDGRDRLDLMRIEERIASEAQLGKCSSHMAIAFTFLYDEGVRPLDAMVTPMFKNHTFVVIGRAKQSAVTDISTWGQAAVICDPWLETVCHVSKLQQLPYGREAKFFKSDYRAD